VVRAFAFLLVAGLAGCATSAPAPIYRQPSTPSYQPPPSYGPSVYDSAGRAPVHSMLIACNRANGSNIGEVNYDYSLVQYTPYLDTPAGPLLRAPTEGACLSSGFGYRGSLDRGRQHNGVDLANPNGGYIYAAGEGVIAFADYRGGFGNTIEIDHGRGVRTLYAHMAEFDTRLQRGARVYAGQPIGRMGMTGNATGVHLHYEVFVDGLLVDPMHYGRPPVYVSAPAPDIAYLPDEEPIDDDKPSD